MVSTDSVNKGASWTKSDKEKSVPIVLLSGFLGTGKTTTLKHLLENRDNLKIGIIVNDVASVNIDAKLITRRVGRDNLDQKASGGTVFEQRLGTTEKGDLGIIELQNGCACCSLADELFFSVEQLLRGRDFDAIVVELSGVADPMAIRSNWQMAPVEIRSMANIHRIVTLVDAASFGTDYMTWDQAGERENWAKGEVIDDCSARRKVAELLAEQVEAAHLVLLNKVDLASEEEIQIARSMTRALNKDAEILPVQYGVVSPKEVLGYAYNGASMGQLQQTEAIEHSVHDHSHENENCKDPACTDSTHSHDHHDHDDPKISAHTHSHDHGCSDPACSDATHSHSNSDRNVCDDPACADTSHAHSHAHSTSTDALGLSNFVYRASIPFNAVRLMDLLNRWPIPIKETLDIGLLQEAQKQGYEIDGRIESGSPFVGVLRSKGFCWFAPHKWTGANEDGWRHDTAMYWSHAGKHFSITAAGKWWGTLSRENMKKYFIDNMDEFDRIIKEDFMTEEFGDRRQELVFIGTMNEEAIKNVLDSCLCTDEEMKRYRYNLRNYQDSVLTTSATSLMDPRSSNVDLPGESD